MLQQFLASQMNMMKIVQRQAPIYMKMVAPLAKWGAPLVVGAVWFTWPAGSGKFLFGVGADEVEA
jgi:hypothetical protein